MTTTLASELATLPGLYEDCGQVLGTRPRGHTERITGGLPRGISLHDGALHARARMLAVLASWSGLVAQERGVTGPGRREVVALAGFLRTHLDWLSAHAAAGDFAEEIREVAAAARQVTRADEPKPRVLGTCARAGCGRRVVAIRQPGTALRVRCEAGHHWPSHQWLLLGGAL